MKITIGEWRMRNGGKVIVGAINESSREPVIGWRTGQYGVLLSRSWQLDGSYYGPGNECEFDLIAPWTDPVPWDWSTTPPWINWIVLSPNGFWWMHSEEPIQDAYSWIGFGECAALIPQSYHPKWSGDWKLSKTQRPKEAAK
jgi:hypothetical protein